MFIERSVRMNKLFAYIVGAAYGAGLMYFWDPNEGRRRRAMLRDQVDAFRNEADDVIHSRFLDLQNRARGMAMETTSRFRSGQPADQGLDEREHAQQGETDWRQRMSTGQWRPSTRLLAGMGTLYLLLRGRGGGILGPFFTIGGWALGMRSMVNRPFSQMFGESNNRNLINVNKSIRIDAPIEEVYGVWSDFPGFPRFMKHVREIQDIGGGRSHWVVDGPAGKSVEFDAIVTQDIPNEMIAWQTTDDAEVKNSGQVRFKPAGNNGTQVRINMGYNPPAGVLGAAVAAFFGSDPKSQMDDDLMRLKSLLETGKPSGKDESVTEGEFHQER
jgi:uncharacterized membrane protein